MDFLGIGPLELIFVFLIALIFLGPTDMVKAGRTLGRTLRKIVTSDTWREITRLRTLPNQLMREAGLEEELQELKKIQEDLPKKIDLDEANILGDVSEEMNSILPDLSAWTNPAQTIETPKESPGTTVQESAQKTEAPPEDESTRLTKEPDKQP